MLAARKSPFRQSVLSGISILLIILWVYAASSKLLDYEASRQQMLNQVFPNSIAYILIWLVPIAELITAGLLLSSRTAFTGLRLSFFLLLLFTIYVGAVMSNAFGYIPCSCGGILESMTWGQHLAFNFFFLSLNLSALLIRRNQCSTYKTGIVKFHFWKGGSMGKEW